jgi:hypothetical protein
MICTQRLVRHEMRRHSKRSTSPLSNDSKEHHAQRLRHILDAQSAIRRVGCPERNDKDTHR